MISGMFAGGLLLAATLMSFALWLQWNERQGWPNESYDNERDRKYLNQRMRSRRRMNYLLFACGVLILVSTFATPERQAIWIACWMSVSVTLLTIIGLAGLDFLRTHRYHKHKLPDVGRRTLDRDD